MKDKVYINIKGLQLAMQASDDEQEDIVEVINVGKYKVVNGKEYIKYDEVFEGFEGKSTTILKIDGSSIELTKKGPVTTHMSFVENKKTMTFYETPFGNIYLGIFARSIEIERLENRLFIVIDYELEVNYEHMADSHVEIEIKSEGEFSIE